MLVLTAALAFAAEGELTFVESEHDGVGGVDGLNGALGVAVSPDRKHVYVVTQTDDSLAAFSRNPTTGALDFVECLGDTGGFSGCDTEGGTVDGLNGGQGVAVSPDGQHVYVASLADDSLAAFARNSSTGGLDFVEFEKDGVGGVDGLNGAGSVTVAPDGKHVYAVGDSDDALAAFARNPTTGALDFVEFEKDGVGGVDGLDGAAGVTTSPDGKDVYVASFADDSLAAFARNSSTGGLDFVEFEKDGVGGVDGLDTAFGVATSPDGKHVYVASEGDDSLAAFARNPTTGALAFVEFEKDGVGGVDGLDFATGVTTSPDGKHVYVASLTDDSLAAFARDPTTGALDFVEFEKDGVGGVDGLDGAFGVATAPDGQHVYVASSSDDALAAFARGADLTAPQTALDSGPPATSDDSTPSFAFSSDDPLFGNVFECKLDEGPYFDCASPYTSFALADGPHRFRVRATDTAQNTDPTPAESLFAVDTTPPPDPDPPDTTPPDTALTEEPPPIVVVKGKKGKKRGRAQIAAKSARARFAFEASEPGSSFECRLDDGAFSPCSSPLGLKLKKGDHSFRVRAVDAAGNRDFSPERWRGTVQVRKR